jgi:hypothetical protein
MQANANEESYSKRTIRTLKQLGNMADLNNPLQIKALIGSSKLKNNTKNRVATAYNQYCKANNITWEKPHYKYEQPIPLIPTTQNVQKIISATSTKYATIFTIMAETAIEGMELHKTPRKQIDAEQGIISVQGTKGHSAGTYKLKNQTAEMLRTYLHKHTNENPFPKPKSIGDIWRRTRNRLAEKLNQPELKAIPLKSLRNYSGAQLYYKIRDPWLVMQHMRHKRLDTTQDYLRGMKISGEEEYTTKTAKTVEEIQQLIESGFTKHDEIDGIHIYRKRK